MSAMRHILADKNIIGNIINKWTPLANTTSIEDITNFSICMEQASMYISSLDNSTTIYKDSSLTYKTFDGTHLTWLVLSKLIKHGIQIRHNYDRGIVRKFTIENLDNDLDYEDFLESIQVNNTYRETINKNTLEENGKFYDRLCNNIFNDIVENANGRIFMPFSFIKAVMDYDGTILVKCKYGFV